MHSYGALSSPARQNSVHQGCCGAGIERIKLPTHWQADQRNKHIPLNQYVSFATTPAGASEGESTLEEMLPGSTVHDPANQVISSEELRALVDCLSSTLSELEARVLALYLDGRSYEEIGGLVDCETKTVDNALQRVKRKVSGHLDSRNVTA